METLKHKPHIHFRKGYWRVANPLGRRPKNQRERRLWDAAYKHVQKMNRDRIYKFKYA